MSGLRRIVCWIRGHSFGWKSALAICERCESWELWGINVLYHHEAPEEVQP